MTSLASLGKSKETSRLIELAKEKLNDRHFDLYIRVRFAIHMYIECSNMPDPEFSRSN